MTNTRNDVYGIGNALVDMEFRVSPQFLQSVNLERGVVTLADLDRQEIILSKLGSENMAKRACGGSAANTMVGLAQFGGKSYYSCKIASDASGHFFHTDLINSGVRSNCVEEAHKGITGSCVVMVTPDAERTMSTHLGITANFGPRELNLQELSSSQYLYIEGYLVASPSAMEAIHQAKEKAFNSQVKVALTFSDPSIVKFFHAQMKQAASGNIDLLFCNEAEALSFTQKNSLSEAAEDLKKVAKTYAITLGSEGSLIYDGHRSFHVRAPKVNAIDTNGAGDMFAGAFLYAITQGHDYQSAAVLANMAAARVVEHFGPRIEQHMTQEVHQNFLNLRNDLRL